MLRSENSLFNQSLLDKTNLKIPQKSICCTKEFRMGTEVRWVSIEKLISANYLGQQSHWYLKMQASFNAWMKVTLIQGDTKKIELTKSLTTHEILFRLKQKFYRIMYNLCSQHLQSLNSVQQKLIVLQPLKDMFQNRSPAEPLVQSGVVTALTRPEPPQNSLCGVTSRTMTMTMTIFLLHKGWQ